MTPETFELRRGVTAGKSSAFLSLTPIGMNQGQRPPLFVPRDELFFWTKSWQAGERESAEARSRGELRSFDSARDLLDWLDAPED